MRLALLNTLREVGKHCEEYVTPDGSTLLLLQHGARVLGLFPPGSDESFYWTHPALESAWSARSFYLREEWHNSGGDRTWISPEIDIFFPDFPRTELYLVPPQLDPGHYEAVHAGGKRLISVCSLTLSRSHVKVDLEITKSWGSTLNPLRYETSLKREWGGIEFAGYEQQTSLRTLNRPGQTCADVGLWNLLQLPPGGEVLIPTYFRSEPNVYFGDVSSESLAVNVHLVRFKVGGPGIQKIGIRAVAATGRIGYVYQTGSQWSLVVRNFSVDPSADYADVPWDKDGLTGEPEYVVQACSVNSELGRFSELEYHGPSMDLTDGRGQCDDISQVWAFRGSRECIRRLIGRLLTADDHGFCGS
jgi:Family of unknown function (DUF6786)